MAPKELLDPLLLPMDTAVEDLPEVNLNAELTDLVQHGMPVQVFGVPDAPALRMTSGEERCLSVLLSLMMMARLRPKDWSSFVMK